MQVARGHVLTNSAADMAAVVVVLLVLARLYLIHIVRLLLNLFY